MKTYTVKIAVGLLITLFAATAALASEVTVYKSPYCGCCADWSDHLKDEGFSVTTEERKDMEPFKDKMGIPVSLRSCHTAIVDGYLIEGHVPAADVKRLLKERPEIAGLTVPGMPIGSPGMEQGNKRDRYNVYGIHKDGSTFIYNTYNE